MAVSVSADSRLPTSHSSAASRPFRCHTGASIAGGLHSILRFACRAVGSSATNAKFPGLNSIEMRLHNPLHDCARISPKGPADAEYRGANRLKTLSPVIDL